MKQRKLSQDSAQEQLIIQLHTIFFNSEKGVEKTSLLLLPMGNLEAIEKYIPVSAKHFFVV